MIISIILWALVWGGMYSEISLFRWEGLLQSPMSLVMTLRPLMPILAVICCVFILKGAGRFTLALSKGPILALTLYGLLGAAFFFLSPEPFVSLYWAILFLAVIFVVWTLVNQEDPERQAKLLMDINTVIIMIIIVFYFFGPLWPILWGAHNPRLYRLPFGLGTQTANGVGRFAAVLALIAFSRLRQKDIRLKAIWVTFFAVSVISLALSESRTGILGFVVGSLLIVLANRKFLWLILGIPGVFYFLYMSWIVWRFQGSLESAFFLTGRETTWKKALSISLRSPLVGHGFHADRLMIEGEHIHMAYLHSLIQSGILGAVLFTVAMVGIWIIILKSRILVRLASIEGIQNLILTESLAIVGFMTARSFFESTAAFYGIDLIFLIPCMAYIQIWSRKNPPRRELESADEINCQAVENTSSGQTVMA